jgi:hypothetical protein
MAALGPEVGSDAASEAPDQAWENWERVEAREIPAGYVFTAGRSKGCRIARRSLFPLPSPPVDSSPWVESFGEPSADSVEVAGSQAPVQTVSFTSE